MARIVPDAERPSQSHRHHSRAAGGRQVAAVVRADRAMDRSGVSYRPRLAPVCARCFARPIDFLLTMATHRRRGRAGVRSRRATAAHAPPSPAAARRAASDWIVFAITQLGAGAARRVAARRLRSTARQRDLGDVGRRAALLAASARLGPPRVCARSAPRAGGRLLGRHRHRDADDAAVARRRAAAASRWRRSRCRRFPFSPSRFFRASSARRRRRCPALPTAFAGLACLALAWGMVVGAAALPSRIAGSAAVRRSAGPADPRLRPLPVGSSFRRSRPAPSHRRGVRAPGQGPAAQSCRPSSRTVLQQIDALDMPNLSATPRTPQRHLERVAFEMWANTNLATERLASSLELYRPEGRLAEPLRLNLPDYVSTTQDWHEPSCDWEIFEEASLFRIRRAAAVSRGPWHLRARTPTCRLADRSSST